MFSNLRWSEAKDVEDLIKLVPTAYFEKKRMKTLVTLN